MPEVDGERAAQLVMALAAVRADITDAATAAGRDPHDVTLVAVTKTFPASDMNILVDLGVRDLGESRDQEARAKLRELAALRAGGAKGSAPDATVVPILPATPPTGDGCGPARLHFVGRLQTNKCRQLARYASYVHTVDRLALVDALAQGVQAADRAPLPVFLQISLDGDPLRGGAGNAAALDDGAVDGLADAIAAADGLELIGVMAVAPLGKDPGEAYERLAEISAHVRHSHPGARSISAGMSGDYRAAVKNGATHVRIGSALLGRRDVTFS